MAWLLIYYTLEVFKWLIVARAVMSWFVSPTSTNPLIGIVRRVTDPVLRPLSEMLPLGGGVDLSPIIAFFAIILLQRVIIGFA